MAESILMQNFINDLDEIDDYDNYTFGYSRHPWLCRWWLKTRSRDILAYIYLDGVMDDGKYHGANLKIYPTSVTEFYVPWWAWPLELTHRLIFGSTKLR